MLVTVENLGLSEGNVNFTYDVSILSISPEEGSTAGKLIHVPNGLVLQAGARNLS